MNFWKKNTSKSGSYNNSSQMNPHNAKSLPSEVREDAAETIQTERKLASWVDDAFHDYEQNGGFENLPGKGKPLQLNDTSGDPLYGVLKNASFLPAWLELQHEIRDVIQKLLTGIDSGKTVDIPSEIEEINKKITKYNNHVPNVYFQKSKLTPDNIRNQIDKWQ